MITDNAKTISGTVNMLLFLVVFELVLLSYSAMMDAAVLVSSSVTLIVAKSIAAKSPMPPCK